MIASLEYAVQVLNTPLIMVLGHEACGAVDATIKSVKDGTTLPGHLPSLVAAIRPAVEAAQGQAGDLLENAIRQNVKLNVDKLKSATPILKSFVDDNKIQRDRRHLRFAHRPGRVSELSPRYSAGVLTGSGGTSSGGTRSGGGACSSLARWCTGLRA